MFPMNRKPVPVIVEYSLRGIRVLKRFDDPYKARQFYTQKEKARAGPRVLRASACFPVMPSPSSDLENPDRNLKCDSSPGE